MNPIYLDYNATTPVDPEVVQAMTDALQGLFGNPSSRHAYGVQSSRAIMQARNHLASLLNCQADEIVFTSGGTESNNMAIQGAAFSKQHLGKHIITTSIEHPAVTQVCRFLEQFGFEITWLPVDVFGMVNPEECLRAIRPDTILISVMQANNETGTIQPVQEIGRIARDHGILFHSDAAQTVGKIPVDVESIGVDLLSVAGHKLYAPKGTGALYVRRGTQLTKTLHGADHEANRRPGTENVPGIVGLGKAAEILIRMGGEDLPHPRPHAVGLAGLPNKGGEYEKLRDLRDLLHEGIAEAIPEVRLNGHPDLRLPNTLSLGFPGVEANLLLQAMPEIAASAGAACHSGQEEVSGVLAAMHVPMEYAMGTIRFSVGRMTTREEIREAIPIVANAYRMVAPPNPLKGTSSASQVPLNPLKGTYSRFAGYCPPEGRSKPPLGGLGVIRLTSYSHALGCACKIRPQLLEEILHALPVVTDSRILVGTETSDDAAVFQLDEHQALVQTVDFIPPVVDDPWYYGAIAASNALSDIYAMGAKPLYALNLVGFPDNRLPVQVLQEILKGASDVAREAGIAIVGGHSISSTEPFFGLSVTGVVDPARILRNRGIRGGDALILTKPLGTGILTTALKQGLLEEQEVKTLMESMRMLNKQAAEIMNRYPVHACTDVTGFGLMGHLKEMIGGDQVDVEMEMSAIPLMPDVRTFLAMGAVPGGTRTNLQFVEGAVNWGDHLAESERLLVCDAQTSGGLLMAVPEAESAKLLAELHAAGLSQASVIGRAKPGNGIIYLQSSHR